MDELNKDITINIDGLGFVLYSEGNVEHIAEGSDFFESSFIEPDDVAKHIKKGDIIGFDTGSSGTYNIKLRTENINDEIYKNYPSSIRLGLEVKGGIVSIIDLYWLMEWSKDIPQDQQFNLDNGFYELTVLTKIPESGIWGDNQEIYIFFEKKSKMPQLIWNGVPNLIWWYEENE